MLASIPYQETTHMKRPTAIKIAEDLTFEFKSAKDAFQEDPDQAVYTIKTMVKLLVGYGLPEPDFEGRAKQITNGDNDANKAKLRRVGKAIERARLAKGLTIAQLAERTGKAPAAVHHWESGTANLELNTILLIEAHLPIRILGIQ